MIDSPVKHVYNNILKPSRLYESIEAKTLILEQMKHFAIWSGHRKSLDRLFHISEALDVNGIKSVVYSDRKGGLKVTDTYKIVREHRKIEGQINILFTCDVREIEVRTRLGAVAVPDTYFESVRIIYRDKNLLKFSIYNQVYTVQRNADARLSLHVEKF